METLVYIILSFVLGLASAMRVFHWYITPKDELYSYYRNTIDFSKEDFEKRLTRKRVKWGIITSVAFCAFVYLLSK